MSNCWKYSRNVKNTFDQELKQWNKSHSSIFYEFVKYRKKNNQSRKPKHRKTMSVIIAVLIFLYHIQVPVFVSFQTGGVFVGITKQWL